MPEERVFGPIRGAGVQLTEEVGQETVEQGRLGTTVLVGPFERGAEGDITILPGRRALDRKMGKLLDPDEFATPTFASLLTPLMARHFWERSRGAGTLICLRVVPTTNDASQDDRPDDGSMNVWNRESTPVLLGSITAQNGGAWAGKRKVFLGQISGTPGTDFPAANQIQLSGITTKDFKYDEYRNGEVTLDGLPGISYKVVNIDPDGLITLEADQDVQTDWGSGETSGSETSGVGPFNFQTVSSAWTLSVTTETGGPDVATFTASAATVGGDGAGTFPLTGSGSIFFVVNGTTYEVALTIADTEAQVIDKIEAAIPGIDVTAAASTLTVATDRKGTSASITIDDGASTTSVVTEVFSTATPTETAGASPEGIANHFEVTAAEIAAYMTTVIGGGASGATSVASVAGEVVMTTGVSGSTGNITMAGNLITLLGFDGLQHDGTDGPSDLHAQLVRTNVNLKGNTKAMDIEFRDGALKADSEFGMIVRVDGKVMLSYENLSMRTADSNYWADVINDDPNNDLITVVDSFTGDRDQATARPANRYGASKTLTATRLTIADPHVSNLTYDSGGAQDWVPDVTWNAWGTAAKRQRLTVTVDAGGATCTISTDEGNRTWTATIGGPAVDMEDHVGNITIDTTSGTPSEDDYFFLYLRPLAEDECIGGRVFPNKTDVGQTNQSFKIIDNGVDYVDVSNLNDLTDAGNNVAGKDYRIEYPEQCEGGYDGYLAGMDTNDYEQLLDVGTSPIEKIKGRGYGLPKLSAPGTTYLTQATSLQQKLQALAAANNWNAKNELPWEYHDWDVYYEHDLVDYINNTLGRTDYASIHFPSFAYIRDPFAEAESDARQRLVPVAGMVLGEEAYTAQRWGGYHKAPAGVEAQLPDILELPAVGKPEDPLPLDEEVLNPAGINVIKWRQGGSVVILWGDRTLAQTTAFKFYHKRCLLSQYEIDLQEGFDFTIFGINDPEADAEVLAALHDYFLPEYRKRAIRGTSFVGGPNPAAIFKMDEDNNTDATRAQGDQIVEISLRLADVIERLRIFIGAMGVVEGTV